MTFHPNDNTKTLFISTNDLLKYFDSIGKNMLLCIHNKLK